MTMVEIANDLAFWFSLVGGVIILHYAIKARASPRRNFRFFAAFMMFYFAIIYGFINFCGDCFGDTQLVYLIRSGVLTRMGVLAMIGLLIGWVITENGAGR
jgi:uncharacterized membrane protein